MPLRVGLFVLPSRHHLPRTFRLCTVLSFLFCNFFSSTSQYYIHVFTRFTSSTLSGTQIKKFKWITHSQTRIWPRSRLMLLPRNEYVINDRFHCMRFIDLLFIFSWNLFSSVRWVIRAFHLQRQLRRTMHVLVRKQIVFLRYLIQTLWTPLHHLIQFQKCLQPSLVPHRWLVTVLVLCRITDGAHLSLPELSPLK